MATAVGQCVSCGSENPYTNRECRWCSTRLPWADALQQALHPSGESSREWEREAERLGQTTEQEDRYRRLFDLVQAVPYRRDPSTKELTVLSEGVQAMTGYAAAELTSAVWSSLVQETIMRGAAKGLSAGEAVALSRAGRLPHWSADHRIHTRRGEERWIADDSILVTHPTQHSSERLGLLHDITERKHTEEQLRLSEELFRTSFESASIGKVLVGLDGRWLEVNSALCQMLGYSESELLARTFPDITHPADLATSLSHGQPVAPGIAGTPQIEKRYLHKHGHEVWGLLAVAVVRDRHGQPLRFITEIQDISARKRYEQQIARQQRDLEAAITQLECLATTDSLTGLRNRRSFDEHLQQEVARAGRQQAPLSLLLLDVDHFKAYNDAFGHPAGDEVLRQVAQRVQAQGRGIDITARYGGEEFAVILPGTPRAGALVLAERLCGALRNVSWPQRAITVSIGVATWVPLAMASGPGTTLRVREELIRDADRALYQAKSNGRNCVVPAQ